MREIRVGTNEAGKRLHKLLAGILPNATSSFLYRMLRKKNIVLNGAKASGKEILKTGDTVTLWFSDETIKKLGEKGASSSAASYIRAYKTLKGDKGEAVRIVHEDQGIVIMHKPPGVLSQKADPGTPSLNEWLIGYLLESGEINEESLITFRPSVANRLDRGTSGLVTGVKTLPAATGVTGLIRSGKIVKTYRAIVHGIPEREGILSSRFTKDSGANRVRLTDTSFVSRIPDSIEPDLMLTDIRTVRTDTLNKESLLELTLYTGRPHQIRAQLSSIGHPIVGDARYGKKEPPYRQLLQACAITFPEITEGALADLSGRTFEDIPDGDMDFPRTARVDTGRTDKPHQ